MDWIYGIQKALDYVETHLTEEIEYGEVAKQKHIPKSLPICPFSGI